MKLIVGLGNPDREYQNTFHNLGFMSADAVAEKLNVSFNRENCKALIAEYGLGKDKIIVAKPLTYMNLSGESVRELLRFYKIDFKDLVVIFDDVELEKGCIRFREKGSAGTHNGMRNIIKELGTTDFARIRVGFNPGPDNKVPLIDLVLSKIKEEDKEIFAKSVQLACDCAIDFVGGASADFLMQKYNRRHL